MVHIKEETTMTKKILATTLSIIILITSIQITSINAEAKTSTSNDAAEIWNYLYSQIQNPYGVAAVMGNLEAESALRSDNLQNSYEKSLGYTDSSYTYAVDNGYYDNFVYDRAGYGLAQWTSWDRKSNLLNYAHSKNSSIGDMQIQLEYLVQELSEDYTYVYKKLKNASSVKDASDCFLTKFERPRDQSNSAKNYRKKLSQKYYDKYARSDSLNTTKDSITMSDIESWNNAYHNHGYYLSYGRSTNKTTSGKKAVKALQELLNFVSDANLNTNSILDTKTSQAIYNYQSSRGLNADRVVGNQTWACMINDAKTMLNNSTTSAQNVMYGDINNDGKVSSTDTVKLMLYINNNSSTSINKLSADLNQDGFINDRDVEILRMYSVGLINQLPHIE